MVDERGRFVDFEVHIDHRQVHRKHFEGMTARVEHASARIDRLKHACRRGDLLGYLLDSGMERNPRAIGIRNRSNSLRHVSSKIASRRLPWFESRRRSYLYLCVDPVDAKRPPVSASNIPGDEIPSPARMHQAMRFNCASARSI